MDYEKKYNEALERARKIHSEIVNNEIIGFPGQIEDIFPELRESEDERIRKELKEAFEAYDIESMWNGIPIRSIFAWLEKQKENPKSADSIPADCVSNAKCEDRWHKTANSLPDNGRDVLAKDALGNYLLASFDGAQWFVSVYDGQDHPVLHTPPILEWCEIPSEKQKKPENTSASTIIPSCWAEEPSLQKEQKSAECSKEDEMMLKCCLIAINHYEKTCNIGNHLPTKFNIDGYLASVDKVKSWLKSLRSQYHGDVTMTEAYKMGLEAGKASSFKPSEEQIYSLGTVVKGAGENSVGSIGYNLKELYEELKKL